MPATDQRSPVEVALKVNGQARRLTERQAREAGLRIKVGSLDMASNGKAKEIGEESGFIKVVVDADDNMLMGAAVLSAEGAELVHTYVDLINANAPIDVVRDAVYIHPTLAEATQTVLTKLEE